MLTGLGGCLRRPADEMLELLGTALLEIFPSLNLHSIDLVVGSEGLRAKSPEHMFVGDFDRTLEEGLNHMFEDIEGDTVVVGLTREAGSGEDVVGDDESLAIAIFTYPTFDKVGNDLTDRLSCSTRMTSIDTLPFSLGSDIVERVERGDLNIS